MKQKNRTKKTLRLVLIGAATITASAAENQQTPPQQLPETVVQGKKYSLTAPALEVIREEIQQTPGGVSVIDAETYKRGRATTLKDALDYTPGVLVQSRFGSEEARLSIRGSGIQRTFHGRGLKLLQDGVPLNLADGGFDFQAVDPLAASRVEVLRGANALELGSTTLGGAINFISPTGYDASPLAIRLEYGSFGSMRGQITTGGVQGAIDYYASFSHFSQDGYRDHSKQDNQRFFFNIGDRLSPVLETRFYVTYAKTNSELPGNLTKQQLSVITPSWHRETLSSSPSTTSTATGNETTNSSEWPTRPPGRRMISGYPLAPFGRTKIWTTQFCTSSTSLATTSEHLCGMIIQGRFWGTATDLRLALPLLGASLRTIASTMF